MDQLNTFGLYLLGKWGDSTYLSTRMPLKANIAAWNVLLSVLESLLEGKGRLKLDEGAPAGWRLKRLVEGAIKQHGLDPESVLTEAQIQDFNSAYFAFEQVLSLDLSRAPMFLVARKGIYSTRHLIVNASESLSPKVAGAISAAAKDDLNEAGRCLAFGVATAAGYHALRCVEKVLREYCEVATGSPMSSGTMGTVINRIRDCGKGDDRVLAVLDQIRDLHRNPLNHPEVFLTLEEGLELFNICTSAVSAMARQMIELGADVFVDAEPA